MFLLFSKLELNPTFVVRFASGYAIANPTYFLWLTGQRLVTSGYDISGMSSFYRY